MKYIHLINFLLVFLIFIECNPKDSEQSYLYGDWSCQLNQDAIRGIEKLHISANHDLKITDSFVYRISEDGLEIYVKSNIQSSGNWDLKNDTLLISLENPSIRIDKPSLRIISKNKDIKIDSLSQNYDNLKSALCQKIENDLSEMFMPRSNKLITLGKIINYDDGTLIIKNNNSSITLTRDKTQPPSYE
ncbi:MAG: hypothetical protein K2K29_03875 [Muribaculaceae bacterium]|nr:hypothetical protein [Muribaculaceae bacterium]